MSAQEHRIARRRRIALANAHKARQLSARAPGSREVRRPDGDAETRAELETMRAFYGARS